MIALKSILLLFVLFLSSSLYAGKFSGELKLFPEGCQKTKARICKLKGLLTYSSSRNELVWQTDEWEDGNGESGTTDGASIPKWAQPIIGDQYDESYLKAAIIHDHYCYDENRVRPWRETHRMFYDALIDLGVNKVKAKIMYFAVYWKGPKWVELVPGQGCGDNCIKHAFPMIMPMYSVADNYEGDEFNKKLLEIQKTLADNPEMSIEQLEEIAQEVDPDNFFFEHGASYVVNDQNDPILFPTM